MKPDWKDAPEWAQWLAMDRSGDWYWHEKEPKIEAGHGTWDARNGRIEWVDISHGWDDSLEARP